MCQLGYDNKISNPSASKAILEDFYVDDLLTGSDTINNLLNTCAQIDSILKSGGFTLRKWVSNEPQLLKELNKNNEPCSNVELGDSDYLRTLGVEWNPNLDYVKYTINNTSIPNINTKRSILSFTSKIFDPLGLLSPFIIVFKILLQTLWTENLDWNDPVPTEINNDWKSTMDSLILINNLNIPRHSLIINHVNVQLHGFCDASEKAYGACIYLRSTHVLGNVKISLLCAKSKVAPLKTITIPGLELCAAVILTKLSTKIISALSINLSDIYLWSDSTIVLSWLKLTPNSLKTFVSNRTSEILYNMTSNRHWRHMNYKSNPADLVSRGVELQNLIENLILWSGQPWLHNVEEAWPTSEFKINHIPDMRKCTTISTHTKLETDIFSLYSSLRTLMKTHMKRVLKNSNLTCYSVLVQIKAKLNSRPLYPMSTDPSDLRPITPGHYLVGRLLTALPDVDYTNTKMNNLLRFHFIHQLLQHYWKRWSADYVNQLQQRQKWKRATGPNITPGMLVLIKEDNVPPLQWTLGRVVHLIVGSDDQGRVAVIATQGGPIKRAVRKLAPLPEQPNWNSSESNAGTMDEIQQWYFICSKSL